MKKRFATKSMLVIRAVIAVYLVYLSYDLGKSLDWKNRSDLVPNGIFCIIFGIAGVVIAIYSLFQLKNGIYEGGAMDPNAKKDEPGISDDLNGIKQTACGEAEPAKKQTSNPAEHRSISDIAAYHSVEDSSEDRE